MLSLSEACRCGISPYIRRPVSPGPSHCEHMTPTSLDVVGIGNAIVDVIAHADDALLAREALAERSGGARTPAIMSQTCAFRAS